jgi:hypothetical protein
MLNMTYLTQQSVAKFKLPQVQPKSDQIQMSLALPKYHNKVWPNSKTHKSDQNNTTKCDQIKDLLDPTQVNYKVWPNSKISQVWPK